MKEKKQTFAFVDKIGGRRQDFVARRLFEYIVAMTFRVSSRVMHLVIEKEGPIVGQRQWSRIFA